jgi:hypothetical protein
MSTRHFSAERTRRNGASISSGGSIVRNRQRRANLATSNSSAISSRSIAKTWKRSGRTSVVPRPPASSSWTKDVGIFVFQSLIGSALSNSEKRARWREPARIIRFAVATAMRQDEIARVEWRDFDASGRTLLIRNRKDPRKKKGNDQRIPLLDVSGYDACKIIEEQGRFSNIREGRIFPYNGRSVGTAFRRQCRDLKIDDLHFHTKARAAFSRLGCRDTSR